MEVDPNADSLAPPVRQFLNKVPAVTATFWLIKILSTTIGETFADFLAVQVGLGTAVTDAAMFTVLCVTLVAQLRTRRLVPWLYWLAVVEVSIVGTQITDFFTDQLGVSLYVSTAVFAVLLAAVFAIWWGQERTLAITAIDTPKRERFYWGAILVTFALGTAGGDLATEALSLGFRSGVLIFGGLILAVWVLYKAGVSSVPTFWVAYVLTRPLGASLGDLLTQDPAYGGVGLGAGLTSALFLAVIVILVLREQVNVNRFGIRAKGEASPVHRRRDYTWAVGGALVVAGAAALLGTMLNPSATDAQAAPALPASSGQASGIEADATSPLGDLRPFAVIVDDIKARADTGDLTGTTKRAKDLEVAWDSAEAAIKPTSPNDWHTMDAAIDETLTAVRAASPSATDISAAAAKLQAVVAALDQKK
jgi:uncharacterized membrane-anchored protein